MPDPRIIFHIGLHKTGTTWLQEQLFRRVNQRNVIYCDNRPLIRGSLITPRYLDFSPSTARKQFLELQTKTDTRNKTILISDEALAGFPFGQKFMREIVLKRIREAFPEAHILVTIREQRALIRSYYGHYIRGGGTASLKDFLAQPSPEVALRWDPLLDLDFFDYSRFLYFLKNSFGKDRVTMVPMEWMMDKSTDFLMLLRRKLGLDLDEDLELERDRIVNRAWSSQAFEVARILNHLYAGKPRWPGRHHIIRPNSVAATVDRLTPNRWRQRGAARQAALVNAAVGERYDSSNGALATELGINLERYGFRTPMMISEGTELWFLHEGNINAKHPDSPER